MKFKPLLTNKQVSSDFYSQLLNVLAWDAILVNPLQYDKIEKHLQTTNDMLLETLSCVS